MKKIIFFFSAIMLAFSNLFISAFAQEDGEKSGILSKINANFLMGNFGKIILIIVLIGCIAGLIYSNIKAHRK